MPYKTHPYGKYKRYRIRSPTKFRKGTLRTHDIGRKGHSKRVAGILRGEGTWATQSILIKKGEPTSKKMRMSISRMRQYAR
jgi:hypothetical protein